MNMKRIAIVIICMMLLFGLAVSRAGSWACPVCGRENESGFCEWCGEAGDSAASSTHIEGVTDSLYEDGLALVKSFVATQSIKRMSMDDGIMDLLAFYHENRAAIDALMPENPLENDALFISVLQSVWENSVATFIMSNMEAWNGNGEMDYTPYWSIVGNSIEQLESAAGARDLETILNGNQEMREEIMVAPTPSPTPAPQISYPTLSKGDKGDAVRELKIRLHALGFMEEDCDSAFGSKTQTAVKQFQKAAGLEITGIADKETQAMLFSDNAPHAD